MTIPCTRQLILTLFCAIMFMKDRVKKNMNKQESDILNALLLEPYVNQRLLVELSGHSLGIVNRAIKSLIDL